MKARWLAAGTALLAVGFVAGWLVFGRVLDGGSSTHDIETRLLRDLRGTDSKSEPAADGASCEARQAADRQYLCTVIYGLTSGSASDAVTFLVTDDGDGHVTYKARLP